jgi:CheY-like chemotaxis protein
LLAIINEILDFSKIEAGKVDIEMIPFDIAALLNQTAKSWQVAAAKKGLALRGKFDVNLPSAVIGDPARLQQIIANLFNNAIKFTRQGGIFLEAEALRPEGGEAQLHISVSDTGIGIPPDKQKAIFEAFSQADISTTRGYGGTGLGLSICTRLAALMGGSIRVDSEPGQGSTFHITLPLNETAQQPQAHGSPASLSVGAARSLEVLVAEDHPVNQALITALLETLGHRVTLANNGREAVDLWATQPFDLVLMDMQMPVMGGLDATRAIRGTEQKSRRPQPTPIYALTAAAMQEDQALGLEAGLDGYLTKPINRDALYEVLGTVAGAATGLAGGNAQSGPASASGFDYAAAVAAADPVVLNIVGTYFLNQAPAEYAELRQAVLHADWPGVARLAHACRGLAGNFDAAPLQRAYTELEQVAKAGAGTPDPNSSDQLTGQMACIEAELAALCGALRARQEQIAPEPMPA